MEIWRRPGLFFCGLLLLISLLLPSQALAEWLAHGDLSRLPELRQGTVLLRLSLVGAAGLLLALFLFPASFATPGLPGEITGLKTAKPLKKGSRFGWRFVLLLGGLGTFLRLFRLGSDLWLDEISTLTQYSTWPLTDTVTVFVSANQHVLYATLANISVAVFGATEAAVRLPAVLFGVAAIFALYYLARILTSESEALWATALLTVMYHHIWFSQNARGWTGVVFFSLLGSGLFLRGLAHNRSRTWLLYSLVMALGIFTHINTLFVFFGHLAAYLWVVARRNGWQQLNRPLTRRLIWVGCLTGIITVGLYSFILPQVISYFLNSDMDSAAVGWTNPFSFLAQITLGLTTGFLGLGALLVGLIILLGLVSYWRQSRLLITLLLFPVGFNVLAYIALQVGAYPRHFLYMLPLGLIIAVRGGYSAVQLLASHLDRLGSSTGKLARLASLIRQYAPSVLLGLVLIASLMALIPYYRTPKQDYSGALAYVEQNRQPGEAVAAVGLAASSYRDLYGPDLLFPETVEALAALEEDGRKVWVIYTFSRDMRIRYGDLFDYLEDNYSQHAVFPGTVGDGTIYVLRTESKGE